jgi:Lsr2
MQVTIDSRDRLEDVLRVVGSVYGVALTVTSTEDAGSDAAQASATSQASAAPSRRGSRRAAAKEGAPRRQRRAPAPTKADMAAVRSWAREQGHDVSDRGRVPNAILEAYRDRAEAS